MGRVVASSRGRKWLQGGHPWLYADDAVEADAGAGELVAVEDESGQRLGWGLHSAASRIRVRLVTRAKEEPGREFWTARVDRAIGARERMGLAASPGACRLIAGDADGFPGFVLDRYADVGVVQSGTQGSDRMRDSWVELALARLPLRAVLDRSDSSVRKLEELEPRVELLRGELGPLVEVREDGLTYDVDVWKGHKTGHYLDQRENRALAARRAAGRSVLDAFSYDGLFGVRAALAGATSVLCLDQSRTAGERALAHAAKNGVGERVAFERVDVMKDLRERARRGESYGLVVLDPPAFARNRRELPGAERGYGELNLRALRLVEPGGTLVSASCSHAVRPELFVELLARAAREAGRDVYLEELRGASPDHPALLTLPESSYLKCAFLRVES
jgi:23S rRNA (cytosine1962-C5)-methyltransferase